MSFEVSDLSGLVHCIINTFAESPKNSLTAQTAVQNQRYCNDSRLVPRMYGEKVEYLGRYSEAAKSRPISAQSWTLATS